MSQPNLHRLVDVTPLKGCVLWSGSQEETDYMFFGLRLGAVLDKIARLEACDDLTPNEVQYLQALKVVANAR